MSTIVTPTKPVAGPNAVPVLRQYLADRPHKKFIALVDENTHEHCLTPLITEVPELYGIDVMEVVSGEDSKDLEICQSIWEGMIELGADRNTMLVNLGGGVICDLGGFVAGCFKRGIDYIHVPTTLLAMVDASLGGKTGVNIDHLKNQIGLFNQPEGIFIDPRFLSTLPEREIRSGMAEMMKHGLIRDAEHWNTLINTDYANAQAMGDLIIESIAIKQAVVEDDPLEHGIRKILNYGHTLGHAVESLFMTMDEPLLHGEAVAYGLVTEAWLSHKVCGLPKSDAEAIAEAVFNLFDKVDIAPYNSGHILELLGHDKKNKNGTVRYALLEAIGSARFDVEASDDLVKEALDFYNNF